MSIADVIKKSLVLHNEQEGTVLNERKAILNKMVSILATSPEEVRMTCSDILTEVI